MGRSTATTSESSAPAFISRVPMATRRVLPMMRLWTEEIVRAAHVRYRQGEHVNVLAAEHGGSRRGLYWAFAAFGLARRRKVTILDEDRAREAHALYLSGVPVLRIAARFCMSAPGVYGAFRRFDLPLVRRQRKAA